MHQINIHQNTQDLTYVTKLHFCRHYHKGFEIHFHKWLQNQGNLVSTPPQGLKLPHPIKRNLEFYELTINIQLIMQG